MTNTIDPMATAATLLSALDIAAVDPEPLGEIDGVTRRVVWHHGTAEAGVLRVEPGARLGDHAHRASHHHMWILEGAALILGRRLGKGSYVHIPLGTTHDVDARETEGCTVLYVYAPET